jgi:hypothetical protein
MREKEVIIASFITTDGGTARKCRQVLIGKIFPADKYALHIRRQTPQTGAADFKRVLKFHGEAVQIFFIQFFPKKIIAKSGNIVNHLHHHRS